MMTVMKNSRELLLLADGAGNLEGDQPTRCRLLVISGPNISINSVPDFGDKLLYFVILW